MAVALNRALPRRAWKHLVRARRAWRSGVAPEAEEMFKCPAAMVGAVPTVYGPGVASRWHGMGHGDPRTPHQQKRGERRHKRTTSDVGDHRCRITDEPMDAPVEQRVALETDYDSGTARQHPSAEFRILTRDVPRCQLQDGCGQH